MIKSLLIANRGEIAVRIIKTARILGIKTYAILTSKEPNALYVKEADEIVDFSGNGDDIPEFLDIDKIVSAAKELKIEAIHPGYGFLAENAYFAQCCHDENIIFIGPTPDSIYKMGNKTIARNIARKHKIPLTEGSTQNVKDSNEALKIAEKIGYPIMIKAASGGGGKGMRIVKSANQMEKMFRLASSEAEKAFNDGDVFVEKYIEHPRHIEIQIVADRFGNVVHLGERECSIQRKHQKLIEEAPSVAVDEKLREKMGDVAKKIALAVNYENLGTVEFLLDKKGNFYFMEMNTRVQVEHPVTEQITGFDLIELQIRIASGEKLKFKQEDVKLSGWSMEFRINAEDVQTNFSPNTGIIESMSFPHSKYVRVDTGFTSGSVIPPNYDSMIAKLIVSGETREKTITSALNALNKIKIKGLKSTIPFHKAVLNNKQFRSGNITTAFIEDEMESLFHQEKDEELLAAFLAIQDYLAQQHEDDEHEIDFEGGKRIAPWVMNKRLKSI